MVWCKSPLAPIGKIKSGKQNTVKRHTPNSATPIDANTMFLQRNYPRIFSQLFAVEPDFLWPISVFCHRMKLPKKLGLLTSKSVNFPKR
jgi:hypothetical protein